MSRLVGSWLYPGVLTVADISIGALCYDTGAVGIAVLFWLTAAAVCVGSLMSTRLSPGIARPA